MCYASILIALCETGKERRDAPPVADREGISVPHLMTTSLLPENLLKKGCQGSLYDQRLLFEAKYNILPRRTKPAVTVAGLLLNVTLLILVESIEKTP